VLFCALAAFFAVSPGGPVQAEGAERTDLSLAPRDADRPACLRPAPISARLRASCRLELNTGILSGPSGTVHLGTRVAFAFASNRARSRFQCRLDSARWKACRSPVLLSKLRAGRHSFSVRARENGSHDRSPAVRSFDVVDVVAAAPGGAAATEFEEQPPASDPEVEADAGEGPVEGPATLFAPDSVWSTLVADPTPVDPGSSGMIGKLIAQIDAEREAEAGPSLGIWSRTSLYEVGPDQRRVPVFLDTGPWGDLLAARFSAGVPIPEGALPVRGQDHSMTVWQPSSDSYWEFFHMEQTLHPPQFSRLPTVSGDCVLFGGTYAYKITSLNDSGETSASVPPLEVRVPPGGCVTIYWSPIHGATGYRIYRGTNGSAVSHLATVSGDRTRFTDDGLVWGEGTPPPALNTAATPGEWHATYGGFIPEVSKSPGYYQDVKDVHGNIVQQSGWGASATGLPLAGGLITKEDIDRGRIDHALSLGLVNTSANSILRAGTFAFPAQRSDGRSPDPSSIPEGARLVLDPELDIASLDLSPFARMLAEAAQRYGMIVHDGSQATMIYAEDPSPYVAQGGVNFYRPLIGSNSTRAMRKFPWSDLQVVQMHLCTLRPCIAG